MATPMSNAVLTPPLSARAESDAAEIEGGGMSGKEGAGENPNSLSGRKRACPDRLGDGDVTPLSMPKRKIKRRAGDGSKKGG